jgi:hypothetical protein
VSSPGPDAMVSCAADDDGEWDEVRWCGGCLMDRMLSMTIGRGGTVWGTCEWCCQRLDYTPADDAD